MDQHTHTVYHSIITILWQFSPSKSRFRFNYNFRSLCYDYGRITMGIKFKVVIKLYTTTL